MVWLALAEGRAVGRDSDSNPSRWLRRWVLAEEWLVALASGSAWGEPVGRGRGRLNLVVRLAVGALLLAEMRLAEEMLLAVEMFLSVEMLPAETCFSAQMSSSARTSSLAARSSPAARSSLEASLSVEMLSAEASSRAAMVGYPGTTS